MANVGTTVRRKIVRSVIGVYLAFSLLLFIHVSRVFGPLAAIERAEGSAFYDWDVTNGRAIKGGQPWGLEWLVHTFGVDYFGNVAMVFIPTVSDNQLVHIGQLEQLQDLIIWKPQVTDVGLRHLKALNNLSGLDVAKEEVA